MKEAALKADYEATLGWLDDSLEWARSKGRTRLANLLNLVQTEVHFDVDAYRALTGGSAYDANRGI